MEGKKLFIIIGGVVLALLIILATVFLFNGKDKPNNQPIETNTNQGQNTSEPTQTDTPQGDNTEDINNNSAIIGIGTIQDGEPIEPGYPAPEWEEPPVMTVYNPEADTNSDGHVDKSEWEEWIANHPEDLDQDLIVTDEELAAAQDPTGEAAESIKPVTPEELEQQAKDNNVYDPTELIEEPQPGEQYSTYDPVLGDFLDDLEEWSNGEGANAAKGGDHSGEPGAVRDEHGNWTLPGHRVS